MAAKKKKAAKKRRTGRPSKLTPETTALVCSAIRKGVTYESAALKGGISEKLFYLWMAKGKKATTGKHREFLQAVQRARAEGEEALVERITAGAPGWKGAAWILERRWREDYSRHSPAETRRLEAEADLAEAKAQLARDQSKALAQGLSVDLTDDDGNDITTGITAKDVAAASPTPMPKGAAE